MSWLVDSLWGIQRAFDQAEGAIAGVATLYVPWFGEELSGLDFNGKVALDDQMMAASDGNILASDGEDY